MRPDVDIGPTLAAVEARAGGRCEECGAVGGRAASMLEGVPTVNDTLFLCATCEPRVTAELGAIASIPAFHDAIERKLRRR
jgi:hypothetical protein